MLKISLILANIRRWCINIFDLYLYKKYTQCDNYLKKVKYYCILNIIWNFVRIVQFWGMLKFNKKKSNQADWKTNTLKLDPHSIFKRDHLHTETFPTKNKIEPVHLFKGYSVTYIQKTIYRNKFYYLLLWISVKSFKIFLENVNNISNYKW